MNSGKSKSLITAFEPHLARQPFVVIHTFERNGRPLHLALTERLRKSCRRGKVWKSKAFLKTVKNAQYGFDDTRAHSPGGSDGIFVLTRDHRRPNEMMKKIFDRFLDQADSGMQEIAKRLECSETSLIPVRLVSHQMRLLGVLHRTDREDTLMLVDYDDSK